MLTTRTDHPGPRSVVSPVCIRWRPGAPSPVKGGRSCLDRSAGRPAVDVGAILRELPIRHPVRAFSASGGRLVMLRLPYEPVDWQTGSTQ
jgi:hypothetical protein